MNAEFKCIVLNNNNQYIKIKHANYDWQVLLVQKELLYEALCKLLFDKTNMFFYLTQRSSTKTLSETKLYVNKLEKQGLLNAEINSIFKILGWNEETLNIESTVFQGDLAEYLMSILIEELKISKTLISKISLKTNSKMPIYGNDNVYFDIKSNVLYLGESKFYKSIDEGLTKAFSSIEQHDSITEINFLTNHTNNFISENQKSLKKVQQKFETISSQNFTLATICFVVEDEMYLKKDIEEIINKYENKEQYKTIIENSIIIILPVLSKQEFLVYFKNKVGEFYE